MTTAIAVTFAKPKNSADITAAQEPKTDALPLIDQAHAESRGRFRSRLDIPSDKSVPSKNPRAAKLRKTAAALPANGSHMQRASRRRCAASVSATPAAQRKGSQRRK